MRSSERFVVDTVVLGLLVAFVWTAIGYPYRARLVPLIVGVPALTLMIINYVNSIVANKKRDSRENSESEQAAGDIKRELGVIAWIAWLVTLTYFFGFHISIVLFLFPTLKFRFAQSLKTSAIITIAVWLGVYLCFEMFLKVPLNCGILFAS